MKKIVTAILTVSMAVSVVFSAGAAAAINGDSYNALKKSYDSLYTKEYVKAYTDYNSSIDALIKKIQTADITTQEQIDEVTAFVNSIKTERLGFFGNRTTPGKSRFDVPSLRTAMYDAVKAKDYATAYSKCQELTQKINDRITFLNGMKSSISSYVIPAAIHYSVSYSGFNGEGTISIKSETKGYTFSLKQELNTVDGRLVTGQSITIQCYSGSKLVKEYTETVPTLAARCAPGQYYLAFQTSSNSANSDYYIFSASSNGVNKMVILVDGTTISTINNVTFGLTYWIDLPKSEYGKKSVVTVNFYNGNTLVKSLSDKA